MRVGEAHAMVRAEGVGKKFCADGRLARQHAWTDLKARLRGRLHSDVSLREGEFWAFKDASFSLRPGQSLALLGLNGAGKSTLLKLLAGRLLPSLGRIETCGSVASLTAAGLSFRPGLTGRENVYLSASAYGQSRARVEQSIDEILDFADIGRFVDSPLGTYSSGMTARLAFAITAVLEPEVLLVDEALTVGDLAFQRKCLAHTQSFLERGGILVLVTHDPHLAGSICQSSLLIHQGRARLQPVVEGIHTYMEILHDIEKKQRSVDGGKSQEPRSAPLDRPDRLAALLDVGVRAREDGVRSGRPADFFIRVWSLEPREASFGIIVETEDGNRVVTGLGHPPGEPSVRLPAGESEIHATVPYLPLAPGHFTLRGFLLDPATGVPYDKEAVGYVSVADDGSLRSGRQLRIRQLAVMPEPLWSVTPCFAQP